MKMFFTYIQNNSGGRFHVDDSVAHYVIIEAKSVKQANRRAEDVGLYWDGVAKDRDCDCCGDRWYSVWNDNDGTEKPLIYDNDPATYGDIFAKKGDPICHIYYADGRKVTYRK